MEEKLPFCQTCIREKCPFEGNWYAFERIKRIGGCIYNVKKEEVKKAAFQDPLKASKKAMKKK